MYFLHQNIADVYSLEQTYLLGTQQSLLYKVIPVSSLNIFLLQKIQKIAEYCIYHKYLDRQAKANSADPEADQGLHCFSCNKQLRHVMRL